MYGMVNKAVQDLVCSQFGEDQWEAIKKKAGVEDELFISHEGYPDEITYRLVGAASEVLGLPADEILKAFGEHWVLKTAAEGYGEMLDAAGADLGEFLVNLPRFHTRVAMIFPKLKPPSFAITDRGERSLRLHYHTHRDGLAPFVVGLLGGLAKRFDVEARITQIADRTQGADHDEFQVEW